MSCLITADVHLTDLPRDDYRWGLLPWLGEQAKKYHVKELLLLGDVTDRKDNHSAQLVNRLARQIVDLADVCPVIWLKGNHDFLADPRTPFFRFLSLTDQDITYLCEPAVLELSVGKATFIPAGVKWDFYLHDLPYCFAHVTFQGAKAENGRLLPGADPERFKTYRGKIYAGDIHVPQQIRPNIEYIGAPYHIRFGDCFEPRVLLLRDDGSTLDLQYPAPRKHVLEVRNAQDMKKDGTIVAKDQVKIRLLMRRAEYDQLHEQRDQIRQRAAELQWDLIAIEPVLFETVGRTMPGGTATTSVRLPEDWVRIYARRHKADPSYIAIAESLLA